MMNNYNINQRVGDGDSNQENESLLLQVDPYVSISYFSHLRNRITYTLLSYYRITIIGSIKYLKNSRFGCLFGKT